MKQRTVVTPWRHLGRCVVLLAGLMITQPVLAGDFFLDAEGTPDLAVFVDHNKPKGTTPNDIVEWRILVLNNGSGTAPNTIVKLTLLDHAEYVSGSTTIDGLPIPDDFDGNPFLRGVQVGDVDPGVVVILTFKVKVEGELEANCPVKVQAVVENDASEPVPTPLTWVPVNLGSPKLELEKLSDMVVAAPGEVVTYRMVVRNTGNGDAQDVRVQDSIPRHTHYVPGSTEVDGQPIPDHLGGSPLEAGLWLGTVPGFGGTTTVSMRVQVDAQVSFGAMLHNTARVGDNGVPDQPSNPVDTPLLDRPRPVDDGEPHVPNAIVPVPTFGPSLVTGIPTDIYVCPDDCQPTTANIHVSADVARGIGNTWLQVVGLSASGGAMIQPSLGVTLPERLSREGLIAPGTDTVYFAAFPEPGGQVDIVLSLTPKALQMVVLDQIMQRIAAEAGLPRPTAAQVLAMYNRAPSIPTLHASLSSFGPVPAPPPVPVASDTPFALRPASPDMLDQFTFELENSTQDLTGLLWFPNEMAAFRDALSTVLRHPLSNAQIRPVVQSFTLDDPQLQQLHDELSLVLSTRNNPAKVSFVAQRRPN